MNGELIVVDNSSDDGSAEAVADVMPSANVIRLERNLGFGRAANLGASKATGSHLLFVNPDLVIDQGAIETLQRVYLSERRVGLAAGRLRLPDGSFLANCRKLPTMYNLLFSRGSFFARLFGAPGSDRLRYTLPDYSQVADVPVVAASFVMVPARLFNRLGGFDNRFFMFMEDTDLSQRVTQAGQVNVFVPRAGAVHFWGRGSRAGKLFREYHHHLSLWRYFLKYMPNGFSLLLLPVILGLHLLVVSFMPDRRPE